MKVSHIAPPKMLDTIRKRSYHLAVAQRLAENPMYLFWFKNAHLRGDYIIVDNGAVEVALSKEVEPISFQEVLDIATNVGADEVVMPDVYRDASKTLRHTHAALSLVPTRHRMIVPQGNSIHEWINCLETMYQWGCRSIGIPKHAERFEGGRHMLCWMIEKQGYHRIVDVHLLGVWDNPKEEILPIAKRFPWVRGVDTGVAYAYAQHDRSLTNYAGKHLGLDWAKPVNERMALHNMEILEMWAHAQAT